MHANTDDHGQRLVPRKTFFLYAGKSAEKWLAYKISQHEFESFYLNDHRFLQNVLEHFPGSILLINTLQPVRNLDYINLISRIKESQSTASTIIGTISSPHLDEHFKQASIDFHIPLANSSGSLECDQTLSSILKVLEDHKARGQRQYLRTKCEDEYHATFSIKSDGKIINGFINDISSAGMLASFTEPQSWRPNTRFQDLQLRLFGTTCNISGRIMGSREGDSKKWIILFDYCDSKNEMVKVQNFICYMLRRNLEDTLKYIYPN